MPLTSSRLAVPAWLLVPALLLGSCDSTPKTADTGTDAAAITADTTNSGAVSREVKPTGTKPAWGPNLKPEMQAVIEQYMSLNPKPLPQLTAVQARQEPSAADAAMKQLQVSGITPPPMNCDTASQTLMSGVTARIYTPKAGSGPFPIIVYYHGGGWIIATIDTYHASAQALCEQTGAIVVSVEYRKGPEHKFPTAHDDAFAAYQWALKNAARLQGDPTKVAVAGESAGGGLACAVSLQARDKKIALPKYQLLVYPIAGSATNTPSYQESTQTMPLNKAGMEWFFKNYLRTPADGQDPRLNLVAANLKGLPPTTIIAAEYDPLKSEGKTLADRLQAAGIKVNYQLYAGTTHEFFGMAAVVPEAKAAQAVATADLKTALQ